MTIETQRLTTARGDFGIRRGANSTGAHVLCLHGFPDDASTFDGLSLALSNYGYDVVSMYLRGYSPSVLTGPYDLASLVQDVLAVLDRLDWTAPVLLVGHDYGAQIGLAAMTRHPERFRASVTVSGAHPAAIAENSKRNPKQLWMSRYIVFFQFGAIADRRVAKTSFAYLDRLWRRWSPGFSMDPAHRVAVKNTIAKSMPAPIAMYRGGGFGIGKERIVVPTLFITGQDDGCVLPEMSTGQEMLFAGDYQRQIWPDTGHFPHLEHPTRMADTTLRWFERAHHE